MTAPHHLIVVAGTATEVGKTWVTCALARRLRSAGMSVVARKAAQSFDPSDLTTDADELAAATATAPTDVCAAHRWYPVPMAPPMAAEALGLPPVTLADVAAELSWPDDGPAIGLFETAGGVASPQTTDADVVDVARAIGSDAVLLVADAGLGTINSVRLSVAALGMLGVPITVYLNRFDPQDDLHQRNAAWLADRDGLDVVTAIGVLADRLGGLRR